MLNKNTSSFNHNHGRAIGKKRIKEYVYSEYLDWCFRNSNVCEFINRLDGKTNTAGKTMEDRYRNNDDYFYNFNKGNQQEEKERKAEYIDQKQLYNISYKVHKEINSPNYIIDRLSKDKHFSSRSLKDQNGAYCGCIIVNKIIVNTAYCDVLVLDDTVNVCEIDYPLECLVCQDPNGHTQIVGFGYIPNKNTEGFEIFLKGF